MLLLVFIISSLLKGNAAADMITPLFTDMHVLEGKDVTLICNYTSRVQNLQWYRQYPGSKPENLILYIETSPKSEPSLRLTAVADKVIKQMNLTISSTEVKDSAMYYCALQDGTGRKIIFGQGTTLRVESKQKRDPDIYKLEDSCLATDFTHHSDVKNNVTAVRYSGEDYQNYYSSFVYGGGDDCQEKSSCQGSSSQSDDIEKDEKINFLSLGLFWLRILFLKTVVFNVLVTFKAWMS